MESNVALERAWQLLQGLVPQQKSLRVPLDRAMGHVLAHDYQATTNFPPFQRSRMDGFAVNSEEARAKAGRLPIKGVVAAGNSPQEQSSAHAIEIMTGAVIPVNADAVVKKEECRVEGEWVQLLYLPQPGEHLNQIGEEFGGGQQLVAAGTRLRGSELSLLAMDGATEVAVWAKPRVGLLTTGTELQLLGEELLPGHIYNSNYYGIAAEVRVGGYPVTDLGVCQDNLAAIADRLQEAVGKQQVIITTGGVAGSKYDLMRSAIEAMGGQVSFWKLDIKPGTPVLVATCQDTLIVALSGNPPAAFFGLHLICRPLLAWLEGEKYSVPTLEATLQGELGHHGKGGGRQLYKGNLYYENGKVFVSPVSATKSGLLRYLASGCCYIVAEAGVELEAGQLVKVLMVE